MTSSDANTIFHSKVLGQLEKFNYDIWDVFGGI